MERVTFSSDTYVVFRAGDNEFALPLFKVRQIVSRGDLREPAGGDEGKIGVVQYRGRAIDIIDLGQRLGLSVRPDRQPSIIVLNEPSRPCGILVDSAPIVTTIEANHIRPLPAIVRSPGDPYGGVAKLREDRLVLILDAQRL